MTLVGADRNGGPVPKASQSNSWAGSRFATDTRRPSR
jgi:hypothetical protein